MSTDLQTILAGVRLRLGPGSWQMFPEILLIMAVNEGKNELVRMMRGVREDYFQTTATGTISATTAGNASTITLPSDFSELKTLQISTSGYERIDFQPMDQADIRWKDALLEGGDFASGYGRFYYDVLGNESIVLVPGSDIALSYSLQYIKRIADLSLLASEATGIHDDFVDYIITYAVTEAMRFAGDDRFALYKGKLSELAVSMVGSAGSRQVFHPKYVRGFMEDEEG